MRTMIVAVCLVFLATAAVAQEKPTAAYLFLTNPGVVYSDSAGTRWEGAFGFALQRMFTPRFSGELAVSRDIESFGFRRFAADGTELEHREVTTRSMPVDLTARYHFLNGSSWKPYAGLDARYVDDRAFFGVNGGVIWQFRPALGLRFDAKLLVGDRPLHGERLYNSAGLSWRF